MTKARGPAVLAPGNRRGLTQLIFQPDDLRQVAVDRLDWGDLTAESHFADRGGLRPASIASRSAIVVCGDFGPYAFPAISQAWNASIN
jgi:hypothetical protein